MARSCFCDQCGTEQPSVWNEDDGGCWEMPEGWIAVMEGNSWLREEFCSRECLVKFMQEALE